MTQNPPLTLSRIEKAAVILVAMGKPAASRLLRFFKQDELRALIDAARRLRTIPQTELERIVGEFEGEFTEGAGLMDGADTMSTLLTETLSPEEMSALMGDEPAAGAAGGAAPTVWAELETLDAARLAAIVDREHPQTGALILTNVKPAAAAAVLPRLGPASRGEIVKRMMAAVPAPPAALKLVEAELRRKLQAESAAAGSSEGSLRVASVLNEMDKGALESVMQDLEAAGAPDLASVRSKLFSFEDVALLPQKARVALFDGLGTELVTLALRGAEASLVEAVLSSIGARARRMIDAELASGAEAPAADVARARRTISATAIRMAGENLFELPAAAAAAA